MWTKMMGGARKKAPKTIAVIDPDRCFGAFACSICQAACPVADCIVEEPDRDVLHAVRETIREMTPRDRSFLRMYYYDELSKSDIATRLGIDPERVRLIKSRALQRFRRAFAERA